MRNQKKPSCFCSNACFVHKSLNKFFYCKFNGFGFCFSFKNIFDPLLLADFSILKYPDFFKIRARGFLKFPSCFPSVFQYIQVHNTFVHWPENSHFFAEASLRAEGAVSPVLREEVAGSPRGGRGDAIQPVLVPPRPPLSQAPPGRGRCPGPRLHGRCCAHLQRLLHVTCRRMRVGMFKTQNSCCDFLTPLVSCLTLPPPYYTVSILL